MIMAEVIEIAFIVLTFWLVIRWILDMLKESYIFDIEKLQVQIAGLSPMLRVTFIHDGEIEQVNKYLTECKDFECLVAVMTIQEIMRGGKNSNGFINPPFILYVKKVPFKKIEWEILPKVRENESK